MLLIHHRTIFSIIDPWTTFHHPFLNLHCTFDENEIWSLPLTGGSYWHKVNVSELHFARSFQGHHTWPYLVRQNTHTKYCMAVFGHVFQCTKYGQVGYPWKDLVSIGPTSQKLWPNLSFGRFSHCKYNVKLELGGKKSFVGLVAHLTYKNQWSKWRTEIHTLVFGTL